MKHENKITYFQLIALLQSGIIGISIIDLPSSIIRQAGTDGWISVLIGGSMTIIFAFGVLKLSLYYPEDTFVEYIPKIYGKLLGYVINTIVILYFIIFVSLISRFFADAIKNSLLPNTPQWAILLLFWIAIAYWVKFGIRVIVLSITILFIPILLTFGALILLPIKDVRLENLLPVLNEGMVPVMKGVYRSIPYFFGFAPLAVIVPILKEPNKSFRAIVVGILIPTCVFLLIIIILITRFSVEEVGNMIYPVVTLIRSFYLPGAFIERMESLFFIAFVAIALDDAAIYFYLCVLSIERWSGKPYYTIYILILATITFIISLIPDNLAEVSSIFNYLTYLGLFFVIIVIPIGLMITVVKRRGKK